jgi:hypothetical protein
VNNNPAARLEEIVDECTAYVNAPAGVELTFESASGHVRVVDSTKLMTLLTLFVSGRERRAWEAGKAVGEKREL